eukprot:6661928-Alexandrium_andersonii.AAC.1
MTQKWLRARHARHGCRPSTCTGRVMISWPGIIVRAPELHSHVRKRHEDSCNASGAGTCGLE